MKEIPLKKNDKKTASILSKNQFKINDTKKKRRSAPGPLGDFCIVSFKNSVSFYLVKKTRKLGSILYDNRL